MKNMIENLKKKARKLWRDHKGLIIGGGILLGAVIVAAANSKDDQNEAKPETNPYVNLPEDEWVDLDRFAEESKAETKEPASEDNTKDLTVQSNYSGVIEPWEGTKEDDDMNNDPQLPCGGRYRCNELADNWKTNDEYMSGCGSIIINDVPLANMGQLGQDVIDLCRQAGLEEKGWNNMDNGVACMILGIQSMEIEQPSEAATDETQAEEKKEEDAA